MGRTNRNKKLRLEQGKENMVKGRIRAITSGMGPKLGRVGPMAPAGEISGKSNQKRIPYEQMTDERGAEAARARSSLLAE